MKIGQFSCDFKNTFFQQLTFTSLYFIHNIKRKLYIILIFECVKQSTQADEELLRFFISIYLKLIFEFEPNNIFGAK